MAGDSCDFFMFMCKCFVTEKHVDFITRVLFPWEANFILSFSVNSICQIASQTNKSLR